MGLETHTGWTWLELGYKEPTQCGQSYIGASSKQALEQRSRGQCKESEVTVKDVSLKPGSYGIPCEMSYPQTSLVFPWSCAVEQTSSFDFNLAETVMYRIPTKSHALQFLILGRQISAGGTLTAPSTLPPPTFLVSSDPSSAGYAHNDLTLHLSKADLIAFYFSFVGL